MIAPNNNMTELKPNPVKWIALLTFSLFSALMGAAQVGNGRWLVGGMLIAWGILGGVACTVALFSKRMVLRLTPEGFGFGTLRKRYFYHWSDILVIGVGSIGQKRVCFTLREYIPGEEKVRKVNQGAIGFDRFLPDTYGKKPMELAKLMEDWRHRHAQPHFTEN
jgi:hypothetical protein